MVLADYTFLDAFWSLLVFFLWVAWFILLFHIVADVFRRRDIGGGKKTIWLMFILFVPFLGVFVYLIARGSKMQERGVKLAAEREADFRDRVQQAAASNGGPGSNSADQIAQLAGLRDSGALSEAEFQQAKAKILA